MNVLVVTLDQLRGDCLSVAGHPIVSTPGLDRLAARGVRFARHYSQAAPCGPGRASLYTGTYQMNHRVVANGTPLDRRLDNIALVARRAGYRPVLFGYTDQAVDPRQVPDHRDARRQRWEGVLPGFDAALDLIGDQLPWRRWLAARGHRVDTVSTEGPAAAHAGSDALASEPQRPSEHSHSAFMTDTFLEWLDHRAPAAWFAHLSYLRPHPPYAAAGEYASRYHPDDVGDPIEASPQRHRLHEALCSLDATRAPSDPAEMRSLRAQYFGMVSEVDHQLNRILDHLERTGADRDTVIILTSDHGEQLGDHGYIEKAGFFEQSYHIPAIISHPDHRSHHGEVVDVFTENVDIFATLCEVLGQPVPLQCDGLPLTGFVDGSGPAGPWRRAAHYEFDWRFTLLGDDPPSWPWDRRPERCHLAVERGADYAYVHFGDGSALYFDLAADPTWRTSIEHPETVLRAAQSMLTWRSTHSDRTLADTLVGTRDDGRMTGRYPDADTMAGEALR
jgi:arylsulfatase A-like enzyme